MAVARDAADADMAAALKVIEEALGGETEDRLTYDYLIKTAPAQEDKDIIKGISADEFSHHSMFRQMYFDLTGRMPQASETERSRQPRTYCEGLKNAIIGEQNAVKKYRRILAAMTDRKHINTMTDIITDELRHGILYNYLYTKNGCNV